MGAETRPDHPSNSTGGHRGRASERAVEAARNDLRSLSGTWADHADVAARAMHSPTLGEDRSVRLGDVLDWLRGRGRRHVLISHGATADLLAREFGADDHAR
jgi:hypothetical protein